VSVDDACTDNGRSDLFFLFFLLSDFVLHCRPSDGWLLLKFGSNIYDSIEGSKLISPANPPESEFYGVPDQMTMNMVPLRPCNCRRCSHNNLNQMNYDAQPLAYYNQCQPCSCKRCLQNFKQINPSIESYMFDPNLSSIV
jgi:hypothetical protein